MSAMLIGLLAGSVCYVSLMIKGKLGYDDSLDAFGVHGVGGVLGTLALGLLAQKAVNDAGANGLFFGDAKFFGTQLLAIGVSALYSFGITVGLLKLIDATIGLRVEEEDEVVGLDISQHGEKRISVIKKATARAASFLSMGCLNKQAVMLFAHYALCIINRLYYGMDDA